MTKKQTLLHFIRTSKILKDLRIARSFKDFRQKKLLVELDQQGSPPNGATPSIIKKT